MRNRNRSEPFKGKSRGRRRGAGLSFGRDSLTSFGAAASQRPARYRSGPPPTRAGPAGTPREDTRTPRSRRDSREPRSPRGGAAATERLPRLGPRGTQAVEEAGTGNLNIPPS